ncbi:MAG: hypothetical protein JXA04_09925 [Gammaproteobacteria bacterium]|nr:hypothetical protein [Gammaproteobacteria bacterium]
MRTCFSPVVKGWRLSLLTVACFLCVHCAGDVGRLVGAGKFNTETLIAGGLVIGGVTAASPLTLQQSVDHAELLQKLIEQHAPQLAITGPREVYKALGQNLYSQMLDSYTFHETGSTAFMNLLNEKFPEIRYVVYARIEGNDVRYGSEKLPDGSGLALHAIRGVTVTMRVFDLHARQLPVWAAGLQKVDENSRRVFGQYPEQQIKSLYPAPPLMVDVFKKTCEGLLSELIKID